MGASKAIRRRLREEPDGIKIWATGGGIWHWDSGRDQHYCYEEIKAVCDEAAMLAFLFGHTLTTASPQLMTPSVAAASR